MQSKSFWPLCRIFREDHAPPSGETERPHDSSRVALSLDSITVQQSSLQQRWQSKDLVHGSMMIHLITSYLCCKFRGNSSRFNQRWRMQIFNLIASFLTLLLWVECSNYCHPHSHHAITWMRI
ncbi:hypothetical protein O6H91_Y303400 [Diphasiastrum complanatum]|nr:hypothetical protein O6H91_Y303400 [Diphasiastrum complanatum]